MEKIIELYNGQVKLKFLGPTEDNPSRHMYYLDGKRKSGVTTFIGIKDKSRGLTAWTRDTIGAFLLERIKNRQSIDVRDVLIAMAQPEIEKAKAADLGKKIHAWCEAYIKHKLKLPGYKTMPDMPEEKEVQMGATAFLEWDGEHNVKYLESEQLVYSRKYDYVGTLDIRAIVDGKRSIVDLKSSNGLYNDVRMQTAAYAMADTEESLREYDNRWALRLGKLTEDEYVAKEQLKKDLKRVVAEFKRTDFKDYDIPPYRVFEAMLLDEKGTEMKRDFKAFLHAVELYRWNNETDFYKNNA